MATDIHYTEIFGPTIQGEGPHVGQLRNFLRLAGCNLSCNWCDTKRSWEAGNSMPAGMMFHRMEQYPDHPWVITGGEPLLQQEALCVLLELNDWRSFEMETNGTIFPDGILPAAIDFYSVSPKKGFICAEVLEHFDRWTNCCFKPVCATAEDVQYFWRLFRNYVSPVFVMPQGVTPAELDECLKVIVPAALDCGFNVSDRFHIRLWGNVEGR